MTLRTVSFLALARLGLIAVAVTACGTASSYLGPSGSTTTLMAGWEHHFTIDWTVEPEHGEARRVRGYVSSRHGESAEPVRILAQALDSSGAVVEQQIVWVPGGVSGFQRAYFEIARLRSAAQYRVSVWDYTFLQNPGSGWM
ncbi:MAG TPA: hypothetical protein VET45_06860 [Candidatus Binatia bacterium]|nr:hypothetical protein [Candidatus Binatia bacterium]